MSRFTKANNYVIKRMESIGGSKGIAMVITLFSENCSNYAEKYNREQKNGIARELFRGILTEDQIKEVFDSEVWLWK